MIPDPGRWPSSKGGKGFKEVAKKVHDMGLKFGFHIMRGISTQAVNANTPILDITTVLFSTIFTSKDTPFLRFKLSCIFINLYRLHGNLCLSSELGNGSTEESLGNFLIGLTFNTSVQKTYNSYLFLA